MARHEGKRESKYDKSENREPELIERLVAINRVAKVVKGGRRFGFAALIIVGDGRGRAGFGSGKAKEVPEAIRKAGEQAKQSMVRIPLREGRTLHHDMIGHYGAGKVAMRSAPAGTGIIAGGPVRAVFVALGVSDVVAKSLKSSNPYNLVRAAFEGLQNISSPRQVAMRRSQKLADIVARRESSSISNVKKEDSVVNIDNDQILTNNQVDVQTKTDTINIDAIKTDEKNK